MFYCKYSYEEYLIVHNSINLINRNTTSMAHYYVMFSLSLERFKHTYVITTKQK